MTRHKFDSDRDLATLYQERPKVAPTDNPSFDPSTEWVNYGDVNPKIHGGRFVRWDGSMWHIIETRNLQEVGPQDMIRNGEKFMFSYTAAEPYDVWDDPSDPWTEFSDEMGSILSSLGDGHHLPNTEPFLSRIDYYVADFSHYYRGHDEYHADYWGALPVDPTAERGWSYDG